MGSARSENLETGVGRTAAACFAVGLGVLAMRGVAPLIAPFGIRAQLIATEVALVLPTLALARIDAGLRPPLDVERARVLFGAFAFGGAVWIGSAGLLAMQSVAWPAPPFLVESFRQLHAALRPTTAVHGLTALAALAMMPALCEEFVFRGVFFGALLPLTGPTRTTIFSAVLFGLVHADPILGIDGFYRVPFATGVGLALAALRLATGSVGPTIVAHGTLHAATYTIAAVAGDPAANAIDPLSGAAAGFALVAAGSLVGFGLVTWLTTARRKQL